MIETEKKQERILLVGVELQGMDNFEMCIRDSNGGVGKPG